ncbi:MAG TPA: hypothetical protein VMX79_11255 [bacterium]|nr:hypothetical protein [bacterium]
MRRFLRIPALLVVGATLAAPPASASGKAVTIGTRVAGNSIPWMGGAAAMRFQCLWFQRDINYAGYVNVVEFAYQSGRPPAAFNNVRVWFCHTTKTKLEATFDNNYAGKTPAQVMDKLTLTLSGTGWYDIGIDPNKFDYNNRDNLLMEIRWRGSSSTPIYCWRSEGTAARVYAKSHTANTGTVEDKTQYIRLHIGTMVGLEATSLGRVRALYR